MSLLFNRRTERRAISLQDVWGSGASADMSAVTPDRALRLAPVYAATRLLADSVAALPIHVYRRSGDDRVRVRTPSWLDDPSVLGSAYDWKHRCMTSLLLRGNAYGLKINGGVEWLAPDDVQVNDSNYFAPVYYVFGRETDQRDLVHVRAYTVAGKADGITPLTAFSLATQLGLSATEFGRDWFHNRTLPGSTLKNTAQTMTPAQANEVKERYRASVQHGDVFVHGSDWEFNAQALTPQDSQLVDMLKLSATQIAAVYGVPPEMIGGEAGGSLTYNTVEQNTISLLTHTIRPWITRLESALSTLLPGEQYVRFNVDSMIRTDLEARYRAHRIARDIGLTNVDELRAVEDMPPLPDDQGQDYTPLRQAAVGDREDEGDADNRR